jgi:hypothetical protein
MCALTTAGAGHAHKKKTATSAAYDDLLGVDDDDEEATHCAADDDFLYRKVIGVNPEINVNSARLQPELLAKSSEGRDALSRDDGDDDDDDEEEEEEEEEVDPRWARETPSQGSEPLSKKDQKKLVKAANKERRIRKKEEGRGKKVKKRKKTLSKRH